MQTAQSGDRVQVHYTKRFQDGSTASTHSGEPLEMIVGQAHARLPGLGLALIGLKPGASTIVFVSAEDAYGLPTTARVRCWARSRFPLDRPLPVGKRMTVLDRQGRRRSIRILEVHDDKVVVDTNHRWAGQSLELEVKLISILRSMTGIRAEIRSGQHIDHLERLQRSDEWRDDGGEG
jgi:peptidylprolyl isomerase